MSEIVQCPNKCGRLVRWGVPQGLATKGWCNAGGGWAGFGHMCGFDGADERGDTDDSPTREDELAGIIALPHESHEGEGIACLACGVVFEDAESVNPCLNSRCALCGEMNGLRSPSCAAHGVLA